MKNIVTETKTQRITAAEERINEQKGKSGEVTQKARKREREGAGGRGEKYDRLRQGEL